ncbi:MAG: DNA-primase RepB domain-containing protein [Acetobacteraceae bacterium]|nr:DNA-primase RepB domain-containing protein [Acetobacteraceae bacterium]
MNTIIRGGFHAADRTRAAILGWAAALPATRYHILVIPADGAQDRAIHRRFWSIRELERALGWLRWQNANHCHVVGRPWDPRHVLLDDLTPDSLEGLMRRHRPAAVVESSPGSVQAWITLSERPVEPAIAGAVARVLATRFAGDRGAASPVQAGRVPGLTNRKRKHRSEQGLYPYARLCRADGPLVDPAGAELLAEAEALLRTRTPRQIESPTELPVASGSRQLTRRGGMEEHAEAVARLTASLPAGAVIDRSRLDYAVARRLLGRGMSVAEALNVVLAGEKSRGMAPDAAQAYARRTVEAAVAALGRRPAWAPAG